MMLKPNASTQSRSSASHSCLSVALGRTMYTACPSRALLHRPRRLCTGSHKQQLSPAVHFLLVLLAPASRAPLRPISPDPHAQISLVDLVGKGLLPQASEDRAARLSRPVQPRMAVQQPPWFREGLPSSTDMQARRFLPLRLLICSVGLQWIVRLGVWPALVRLAPSSASHARQPVQSQSTGTWQRLWALRGVALSQQATRGSDNRKPMCL